MDLQLENRVILVVGGTGLIGRAVVERLRAEGAVAVPASRHGEDGVRLDAGSDDSVAAALEEVLERFGEIDGLVIAAAPSAQTLDPARKSDPAQVLAAVDGKALRFVRVANAVLPLMTDAGYGRIVGVSGQNALQTGNLAGSVRNAALIIAAKNLADSAAGTGVTVNTVSPGIVSAAPSRDVRPGQGGQTSPADVADLIAFLVSPLAGTISGESIAVGHRVRGVTSM
ncbi:NADP-dependent 3-hydroxy acid dehydrogenase YdfG [Paramicrobacterium humi]|uniref:NADP-dependent 3-hydroxy acid dehydrogenase YdfG n=1 Tax=Paramicrobacterium humi TaxID=640635 RepID=A0A1H4LLW6_9MICO|nr:SDR family oxidoreductase [Microbacterium humi]SEB71730.1 NADP-dependent 3-hydroxy acid dehydrogenase YdfG [Microbacterium humi]